MPKGWVYIAEFGIRQMTGDPRAVPANVALGHDILPEGSALAGYIGKQAALIAEYFSDSKSAGPQATTFDGADEAFLLFVRHRPENAPQMLHAQTYVGVGRWVGIITLTTPEALLKTVRPDYDAFVKGLRILPEPAREAGAR